MLSQLGTEPNRPHERPEKGSEQADWAAHAQRIVASCLTFGLIIVAADPMRTSNVVEIQAHPDYCTDEGIPDHRQDDQKSGHLVYWS
jgi:hypothetical protein